MEGMEIRNPVLGRASHLDLGENGMGEKGEKGLKDDSGVISLSIYQ